MRTEATTIREVPYIGVTLEKTLYSAGYLLRETGSVEINDARLHFNRLGTFEDYQTGELPEKFAQQDLQYHQSTETDEKTMATKISQVWGISEEEAKEALNKTELEIERGIREDVPIYQHNLGLILKAFDIDVETYTTPK